MSKLTYIHSFPGAGTHLLLDCLSVLNLPHCDIGMLLFDFLLARKVNALESLKDYSEDIQSRFVDLDKLLQNSDIEVSVGAREIVGKLFKDVVSDSDCFIMHPHAHNPNLYNRHDKEIFWSKDDGLLMCNLIRIGVSARSMSYREIGYVRNPYDLILSRYDRFKDDGYDVRKEIDSLGAFRDCLIENRLSKGRIGGNPSRKQKAALSRSHLRR